MNKDTLALAVAVVALAGLGAGVVYLSAQISANQREWARLQYAFGSIEAIAFAAAGWLWGKEVHRQQAASAEARLDSAHAGENAASLARGEAQGKLKTLAEAVVANVGAINKTHDDIGGGREPVDAARRLGVKTSLDALHELASRYRE
jgi:hypothetical protein